MPPGTMNIPPGGITRLSSPLRIRRCTATGPLGRPPKLTPHQRREALRRRNRGTETLADIARSYNVSQATISRLAP